MTAIQTRVNDLPGWRNKAGGVERGLTLEMRRWPGQSLVTDFREGINKGEKSM